MLLATYRFCQAVCGHFCCRDVLDPNNLVLDSFADEMMTYVNVFRARVGNWILGKSDGALVVGEKVLGAESVLPLL